MSKMKLPGTIGFHQTIDQETFDRLGMPGAIDRAAADLRSQLVTMASARASGCKIALHVVATVEVLTDSGGNPLTTRGGS